MIASAHIIRETTGTELEVLLPDEFSDIDLWIKNFGDEWFTAHHDAADEWCWDSYGWEWFIKGVEWYDKKEEFTDKYKEI